MIDPDIPESIARSLLSSPGITDAVPIRPGMSGARVFCCRDAIGRQWALKRWPPQTTRTRLEEIHKVIRHARDSGCHLIPELHDVGQTTIFSCGKACWDLVEWMPGEPAPVDATLAQIRSGAAAIAGFHQNVRALGERYEPAPAISSRLKRLGELGPQVEDVVSRMPRGSSGSVVLDAAIHDACCLLKAKWGEIQLQITRSLTQYVDRPVRNQCVLRDVHREHVLFRQKEPSGLIDYDAVRFDTPATDLARWMGGFLNRGPAERELAWQAALAGYRDENPLEKSPRTAMVPSMAKHLCFATNWISLGNWLVWLVCEQRRFPPGPESVTGRIRELLSTLDLNG